MHDKQRKTVAYCVVLLMTYQGILILIPFLAVWIAEGVYVSFFKTAAGCRIVKENMSA